MTDKNVIAVPPGFSEILRAFAKGLTKQWDVRYEGMVPGQFHGRFSSPEDNLAETQARSTRAAFEALAELYDDAGA